MEVATLQEIMHHTVGKKWQEIQIGNTANFVYSHFLTCFKYNWANKIQEKIFVCQSQAFSTSGEFCIYF